MSQLTTHILDTTKGRPAADVTVVLYTPLPGDGWLEMTRGVTNRDGRIPDLLSPTMRLPVGVYKLKFLTQEYFDRAATTTFYPFVEIVFTITDGSHYHVPLLLNAYGYSTYRGS